MAEFMIDDEQMYQDMVNTRLRDWYMDAFPTDELGAEINPNATFYGLFECLDAYRDVYDYFMVGDSLVRERLFTQLASMMGVDYDYIYEQWLRGA